MIDDISTGRVRPHVEPDRFEIVLGVFETTTFTGVLSGRPDL